MQCVWVAPEVGDGNLDSNPSDSDNDLFLDEDHCLFSSQGAIGKT